MPVVQHAWHDAVVAPKQVWRKDDPNKVVGTVEP